MQFLTLEFLTYFRKARLLAVLQLIYSKCHITNIKSEGSELLPVLYYYPQFKKKFNNENHPIGSMSTTIPNGVA